MRRSYWFLPVVAAAVAALVFGLGGLGRTQAAEEAKPTPKVLACSTCHSMTAEVTAWEQGPHKNVTCLQCHEEGDPGWVRHEFVDRGGDMAEHSTADLRTPKLKLGKDQCLTCHDQQLDMLKQDLTPPPVAEGASQANVGKPMLIRAEHDVHLSDKVGLTCLDCHAESAHGTAQTATGAARSAGHERCQTCHDQKQVTLSVPGDVSCAACHVDPVSVAPADHKDLNVWMKGHGDAAQTQSCGQCHLSATAGAHSAMANPTAFPTSQQQDACMACHNGVPMPHAEGYLASHGQEYLAAKEGTCESCHSPEGNPIKPTPDYAQPQFCTACHLQPMPHPASFLSAHGQKALGAPATCEACHSAKNVARPTAPHATTAYCGTCHDAYQHEAGWVANHGTEVDASCTTCHTTKGEQGTHNACAACHTGDGAWHPELWFVSHGRAVEAQGKEACMTCHNEVEPSCTQCHRNP